MRNLSLALLPVALAAACSPAAAHRSAPEPPPVRVDVLPAVTAPLTVLHRASGTVRGRATAVLSSKTTGYVRTVEVRAGDVVKAGQVLAVLEAQDLEASARRARAGLEQSLATQGEADSALVAARTQATLARTSRDRIAKLFEGSSVSAQELDDADARARAAAAQEDMAKARAEATRHRSAQAKAEIGEAAALLGYSRITAPFAGRVIERHVDPGTLAAPGAPLLVVEEQGFLRVETSVPESRAGSLSLGERVDVGVESAAPALVGRISEIVPLVDVASRAFLVKVDLEGDLRALRPGMFARASFPMGTRSALVVPTRAVSTSGALDRVFVVEGERVHLRMVTLGEPQGDRTEVLSGLAEGEQVVLAPKNLVDGTRVMTGAVP